jgi:hypothetical protein
LLTESLAEWNVVQSCAIICPRERVFVPPYHKWDDGLEQACLDNDIVLIKVEDGWKHLAYQSIRDTAIDTKPAEMKYYFHTYDFDTNEELLEQLRKDF